MVRLPNIHLASALSPRKAAPPHPRACQLTVCIQITLQVRDYLPPVMGNKELSNQWTTCHEAVATLSRCVGVQHANVRTTLGWAVRFVRLAKVTLCRVERAPNSFG